MIQIRGEYTFRPNMTVIFVTRSRSSTTRTFMYTAAPTQYANALLPGTLSPNAAIHVVGAGLPHPVLTGARAGTRTRSQGRTATRGWGCRPPPGEYFGGACSVGGRGIMKSRQSGAISSASPGRLCGARESGIAGSHCQGGPPGRALVRTGCGEDDTMRCKWSASPGPGPIAWMPLRHDPMRWPPGSSSTQSAMGSGGGRCSYHLRDRSRRRIGHRRSSPSWGHHERREFPQPACAPRFRDRFARRGQVIAQESSAL